VDKKRGIDKYYFRQMGSPALIVRFGCFSWFPTFFFFSSISRVTSILEMAQNDVPTPLSNVHIYATG
jgi:hypothetical protein